MTVFVAEINGRAIAAFNAENEIHAEGRAASKPFRADLTVLENEGRPLWNGTDEIFVRKAFPAEEAQFNASQARAISEKEIDEDDDWLMFLVPVTDPIGDFDLSFPKIPSGSAIRVARENHRMIGADARSPALARNVHRRFVQVAAPA